MVKYSSRAQSVAITAMNMRNGERTASSTAAAPRRGASGCRRMTISAVPSAGGDGARVRVRTASEGEVLGRTGERQLFGFHDLVGQGRYGVGGGGLVRRGEPVG